jgi:hypothetical protein
LLLPDRVLQAPWLNTPRTGHLYENPNGFLSYHDGAWLVAKKRASPYFEWRVLPDGSTNPFWTDPIVTLSPTDLRALTNDDHAFATSTELGLSLGLAAKLGVEAGPFDITANVHGSFGGIVTQSHIVRDALMAEEPPPGFLTQMVPSTVVTVRPQQTAEVQFKGLTAGLHFHLSLPFPFDDINFDKTFFNVPGATLADYDSDDSWSKGDEAYMRRCIRTCLAAATFPRSSTTLQRAWPTTPPHPH